MKALYSLIFLFFISLTLFSQTYSFDVEVKNFAQIDETTFEWEIWLKKGEGSSDFALWQMQTRMDFNESILNSGSFTDAYFTIADVGPEMNQNALFFLDEDCTIVGTSPNIQFNWAVSSPPNTGQSMTIISGTLLKVAKFRAQLRKDGSPHNFGDADPEFAFQSTGTQILVTRANTTSTTYDGGGITPVTKNSTTPALGVKVNTRNLAGYWFSGTANWSSAANWNNVTLANYHTLPGASNNAVIAGRATASTAYTVNELTVAEGAYLVLDKDAKVTTTTKLYNDNVLGGGSSALTVAGWNFDLGGSLPYSADIGNNKNGASFYTSASALFYGFFDNGTVPGTSGKAPAAQLYFDATPFPPSPAKYESWIVQLSSEGYSNLMLSSKQYVFAGSQSFTIDWSTDGSTWNAVSGGTVSVSNNWTTGVLTNLSLPAGMDNLSSVFLRWHAGNNTNGTLIDDIVITGVPLPTGILLESSASGTGSLIQNTDGVLGTVQRYIQGTDNYHYISSPVSTAGMIFDDIFPNSYWNNKQVWVREFDEPTYSWINKIYYQTPVVGKGYSTFIPSSYTPPSPPLAFFEGAMGNGEVVVPLSFTSAGWNLVGNPYPSAIDWDAVSGKTNIDGAVYVWGGTYQGAELGNYVTWNGSTGGLTNGTIPAGQGFFVHASSSEAGFTFTNACRVHANTNFWKSGNEVPELLTVEITNSVNTKKDKVFINYNLEATAGFDPQWDAYKLGGDEDAPEIYTVGEVNLSINTLHSIQDTPVVPLGFKAGTDGMFTITANGMNSFSGFTPIYLEDITTGIVTNLRTNPVYTFTSSKGTFNGRFRVWFGAVDIEEPGQNSLMAWAAGQSVRVLIPENQQGVVEIFNIHGQKVASAEAKISGILDIPYQGSPQALFVRFTTDYTQLSCKVITR